MPLPSPWVSASCVRRLRSPARSVWMLALTCASTVCLRRRSLYPAACARWPPPARPPARLLHSGLLCLLLCLDRALGGVDLGDQVAAGRICPPQHVDARQQVRERACGQHVGDRVAAAVLVGGHQLPAPASTGPSPGCDGWRRARPPWSPRRARAAVSCARAVASMRGRRVAARLQQVEAVHHGCGLRPLGADGRGAGGRSGRDDQGQHDQRSGQCARQGMNPPAMCQLCSPRKQTGCPASARIRARGTLPLPAGVASRRQPGVKKSPQTAATGSQVS